MSPNSKRESAVLVLHDGEVFEGEMVGGPTDAVATGEVVFNTALSGYQEIITDPSYAGQMIAFTYPHIGNYGVSLAGHARQAAGDNGSFLAGDDVAKYKIKLLY